jgi:diguanylate cyclase (GGDEF)-like protein/PAS domain S-box-containing protein
VPSSRPLVWLPHAARILVVAAGYFLLAQLSRVWMFPQIDVSPVWLPAGVALAAVLLRGPRALAGVALGSLADELAHSTAVPTAVAMALTVTLAAAAGAAALRRLEQFDPALDRPRHVVLLIGLGGTAGPLIAGVGGVITLILAGILPAQDAGISAALWVSGDALGVLLLGTLILTWNARPAPAQLAVDARSWTLWLLCTLQVLLCATVFLLPAHTFGGATAALVTLPLAAILSTLLPLRWVAVMNCLVFAASASALSHGTGPLAEGALEQSIAGLAIYNLTLCLTTLVVAAVALERQRVSDKLAASLERFRSLTALSADWYWEQDEGLRFSYFSSGIPQRAGVDPHVSMGKTRFEVPVEWESEAIKRQHEEDLAARRPFRDLLLKRTADDGTVRHFSISGEPVFEASGRFRGYRGIGSDVTEKEQAAAALRESEARFRSLVKLSNDWYWEQDEHLRFLRIEGIERSNRMKHFQNFVGRHRWDFPFVNMTEADWDMHRRTLGEHRSFRDLELVALDDNGQHFHILVSGEAVFDDRGRFRGYRGTTRDVTAARVAEQKAHRLTDLFATVSEANNAIIHTQSPESLYQDICALAVKYGHFVFCRITAINPGTGQLQTVAQAGEDRAGLSRLRVSVDSGVPEGRGPTAEALRSGAPAVVNDILADTRLAPWMETLHASSVHALAAFPLRRVDRVVGALHLYAEQPDFFDDDLVAMVGKLALNVSFALDNFARDAARQTAENALRESETRFRDFTEAAAEYVWETDLEGRITFISSRVETISGFRAPELMGRKPEEFMAPGEAHRVADWLAAHRRPDGSFRDLEYQVVSRSGETRWLRQNGVAMLDERGEPIGWRGTGADVTDRRAADERIAYLATRDPLTELPNRVLLADRLAQAIAGARRTQRALAVLFVDLDRFKNINDSLGHEVGDLMLKGAAARLLGCVRQGDTLARLGGDEFLVVLEGLHHAADASQVATKVLSALSQPFDIAGHRLFTSCSIGVSIFPDDAADERALMRNADVAMYHAKERGRSNYQFFSPDMNARAVERLTLETALRLALERDEFLLHYQPQLDIRSGRIVGMEALIRWQHPAWGLLSPDKFIPVAEESGLIEPLGEWILLSACRQARAWQLAGFPALKVAVNISARQLRHPFEFSRKVQEVIEQVGLNPALLELEMTETLLMRNVEENIAALNELGSRRVRIAVDDFGTGYSSLSYIKQLPIDTLKIDRSFTRNLPDDHEGLAIVQATVLMGHKLGLRITAEGVETREQLAALRRMRCDEYQGYLFSKPLPPEQIGDLLRAQPVRPLSARARASRPRARPA